MILTSTPKSQTIGTTNINMSSMALSATAEAWAEAITSHMSDIRKKYYLTIRKIVFYYN